MEKIFKPRALKNAGLYATYSLAFFLLTIFSACKDQSKKTELISKDGKAIAIAIPEYLLRDVSLLRVQHSVRVVFAGSKSKEGIFGDFTVDNDLVTFKPLIPLSPGLSYEVWQDDKLIATVNVPASTGPAPRVAAIYPEQDTLPENQLKIYISFTERMQTGRALDYISLLDSKGDTLQRVFLNLQPELWNEAGTVLTLWLDPGRIKRDLILNRELGNPLHKAQKYQLVISDKWKDHRGLALGKPYAKHFIAGNRDGETPDINKWQIKAPKAGTNESLVINTLEPMDHYLLAESVSLLDDKGEELQGYFGTIDKDKGWVFTPESNTKWNLGHYQIKVQAKLEDLAGNNLNRVFDRDIRKDKQTNKEFFVRGITIQ